ncbi:hypothetical protein C8A00DRAFT_17987 [Chaetomidium leptoderma]|uniref:C2H2-type domain-containing protein n=1 Tax=Chaetomidium leptoderma TaxID=669021 RepID=A0AAN6VFJ2_9PEZI|nr:hypothetical protein C8A00DRAFT_17987 [Chaetomidium leptoderma]
MANPDDANDTGPDPGLDAIFSYLSMTSAQMDRAAQDTNSNSSFWLPQNTSFPTESSAAGFEPTHAPPPADTILAAQINPHFPVDQYSHHTASQFPWAPTNDPSQAGSSSGPAASDKPFACPHEDCDRAYNRQCDLEYHMNNHTKPRKCEICGAGVAEAKDLHRHMWTHHADEARRRGLPREHDECQTCGYSGRTDNVKRHREKRGHQ